MYPAASAASSTLGNACGSCDPVFAADVKGTGPKVATLVYATYMTLGYAQKKVEGRMGYDHLAKAAESGSLPTGLCRKCFLMNCPRANGQGECGIQPEIFKEVQGQA